MLDLWNIEDELKKTHQGGKWPCPFRLLCLCERQTEGESFISNEEGSENLLFFLSMKTSQSISPFSKITWHTFIFIFSKLTGTDGVFLFSETTKIISFSVFSSFLLLHLLDLEVYLNPGNPWKTKGSESNTPRK